MDGIREIHGLRSRRVGGAYYLDLHMLVDPKTTVKSAHDVASELKNRVLDREDVLGHIEPKE